MPDVPMLLRRRRLIAACSVAAATALLVGGLVGCNPHPSLSPQTSYPVGSQSPTISAPPPSQTPTRLPSLTSQHEKEEAAIKRAILAFYDTYNDIRMHPGSDTNALRKVAAGQLLEVELGVVVEWRAKEWRSTRPVRVENLDVGAITDEHERATVTYCINSTGVDVVDREGKSQTVPGRPDFFPTTARLEKRDGMWIPVRERDGGSACDERD